MIRLYSKLTLNKKTGDCKSPLRRGVLRTPVLFFVLSDKRFIVSVFYSTKIA